MVWSHFIHIALPETSVISSSEGLDYVFAHYCGILATSTFYFVVYAAYKQNRPFVNPKSALPGLAGGILWAIAQSAWFVANDNLHEDISFPIITRVSSLSSSVRVLPPLLLFSSRASLEHYGASFTSKRSRASEITSF